MTVTDSQGNVTYVKWVKPECDANTAESSYTLTDTGIATVYLWHLEVRIPPGHAGITGIALFDSGSPVIPWATSGTPWIIGNDDLLEYPYNKELGASVTPRLLQHFDPLHPRLAGPVHLHAHEPDRHQRRGRDRHLAVDNGHLRWQAATGRTTPTG